MPTNSFQEQHLPQVMALYNENLSLHPKRIKERVIMAYHRDILEKLQLSECNPSSLKEILAQNWHKYKTTPCGYTALPESDVTLLLCDIANTLGQIIGEKPIHILMPGVSTESIVDGVPSLDEMELKTVLKTHIISDSGNYLYPVAALGALACETDLASQEIPNPYYDYNLVDENGETEGFIPPAALERMLDHSFDTQALLDAKARYQNLIQPTNLLGQLQQLIKTLRMNSVSGIGEEKQAGRGAYAGIISFNDYYQTLNDEQKNLIPEDLKKEIEFLLAICGIKEKNDDATMMVQTCINIRQSELTTLTKKYEPILINIGVDEKTQSELIKKAREDFVVSQTQISVKCAQGTYHGKDSLALSIKLFETLHVVVEIKDSADLRDFLSLTASDIELLLENNEALQRQVAEKLANFEDLVLFSTQTPIAQMEKVLHLIVNKLPKPSGSELSVWLEMLDFKRFEAVFDVFKSSVIENSDMFRNSLEHLSIEKREMIFCAFEHVLPNLIKKPSDLAAVIEHLSPKQQEAVYQQTQHRIPEMIINADDLVIVLEFLNEKQCKEVLAVLKPRLNQVIASANDVNVMMSCLNVENSAVVFESINDGIPELIKTAKDVSCAFEFLNQAQSMILFEKIKNNLPELIQRPRDIRAMLLRLNVEQSNMIFDTFKFKIPPLILNTKGLRRAITGLHTVQARMVMQLLPPKWTQSLKQIARVLKGIELEHRDVFLEMIMEKLPSLIQSANNVRELCECLTDEQSGQVLGTMIDKIPSLIETAEDFILVSNYLDEIDEEKVESLNKAIMEKLPRLINTREVLGKLIMIAGPHAHHQFEDLFELAKENITNLLKSPRDIGDLLMYVRVKGRPALLETILNTLPNVLKDKDDCGLVDLLYLLDPEQSPELLVTSFPRAIQSAKCFYEVFITLNEAHRKVLFEAMKDKLPRLIKNGDDARYVLARLNGQQFASIFEAIKDQLPKIFKSADVVRDLFDDEKSAIIIAALQKAQTIEVAANVPSFLPHKRLIEGHESGKRQKRVGRREMDFLRHNISLAQPKEGKRSENRSKRQRMSPS